ncbi:hypothetical protein NG819_07895 [Pseudarthrobacter sp. Fe7]|nr:hypothetical protein NG819_07895 [Pseudarthrobacter sp. Fe7]
MPAVTPDTSSSSDAGKPVTRRSSWAEAAAAADATKPSRAPSPAQPVTQPAPPAAAPSAPPIASVPSATPLAEPASEPAPAAAAPSSDAPSFRRSRPTAADEIADTPMPDFISSPGLFVKEQKPRPRGGIRGALYNLTGGAWNLGPGPKQRQEDEPGPPHITPAPGQLQHCRPEPQGRHRQDLHHGGRGPDPG